MAVPETAVGAARRGQRGDGRDRVASAAWYHGPAARGKQRTGRLNIGGPIATAGGLVFIGATNDRRLRAFNSRTGTELWSTRLELNAHAVPVTYMGSDGKQYVAITAAGAAAIDDPDSPEAPALVAYSLP